jgi:hypothetical protein
MNDLQALSDEELALRLHNTMMRHDSLVDSADLGDERIYFAGKECDAIKAEQKRRGYSPCPKCFDFGDITDMHGDEYGFCDCAMGSHLAAEAERRASIRAAFSKAKQEQSS